MEGDSTDVPEDGFTDVPTTNVHEFAIDCVAWYQITSGTSATTYTPAGTVRRDQMASFIAQLIDYVADRTAADDGLPAVPTANLFPCDVEEANVHYENIQRLAEADIVVGTGDNAAGEACYNPSGAVTRDQMATYIRQAQDVVGTAVPDVAEGTDYFADDTNNTHEANINAIAGEGIVRGTGENAAGDTVYNPRGVVRRDQMASFLVTKLDRLIEDTEAEPPPTITAEADTDELAATGDTEVDVTITAERGDIESATVSGCGITTPVDADVAAGGDTATADVTIPDAQNAECDLIVEATFVDDADVFGGTDRTATRVVTISAPVA